MSRRRWTALCLTGALLVVTALPPRVARTQADTVSVDGVHFRRSLTANGSALSLHRAVLFRWRRIIRAYTAALYLGPGVQPEQVLGDVPKRLELTYHVGIDGEDFGPAALSVMGRMYGPEELAPLEERLQRLHAAYRDVHDGDRYSLTYTPGRGTELALNDRPLVLISGADFQRAYFAIWFGRRPISNLLRDQLLGRR